MFTGSLSLTHVTLILINATTVEQLSIQGMRHKERALLDATFPFWDIRSVKLPKLQLIS